MRRWHDGQISTSHDLAADSLGRTTKYVYDNPQSRRAIVVLNCSHQFDQPFANGEAEVKASLNFENAPGSENAVMKLSVVVMIRKDETVDGTQENGELQEA